MKTPSCVKPILLLVFVINTILVTAQNFTPDFTTDKPNNSGCVPLAVKFINTTKGVTSSAKYSWTFGNSNTSTFVNPGEIYTVARTYTVTLTVTDGGTTKSVSRDIIVHKNPVADFMVATNKGCAPFAAGFTGNASPGEGTISRYFWDFGDGTNEDTTANTITHTYTSVQKFNVGLTVTNSFGCQSTPVTKQDFVETVPGVTTSFTADKTVLCNANGSVAFTSTSSGNGTLTYLWNFGDGGTSTSQNPTHLYPVKGTYPVSLTVSSSDGCDNKLLKDSFINVANYVSAIKLPLLLCNKSNNIFTSASVPLASQAVWYFNDNTGGTFNNYAPGNSVAKSFTSAGNYKVKLVNNFGGCLDSVEQNISVLKSPLLNGFFVDNNAGCGSPVTVNFKDTSAVGAVSWLWDFGGGVTSAQKDTAFTYTSNGTFNTQLTITDIVGCNAAVSQPVVIKNPDIKVSYVTSTSDFGLSGCEGFTAIFKAEPDNSVTEYLWDFGDGTTSTDAFPKHTFPKEGIYAVNLSYTTVKGCKDRTTYTSNVNVYKRPKADFTVSSTQVCGNAPVLFSDKSTVPVTSWAWFANDSTASPDGDASKNYTYRFSDSGFYTIKLVATNGVCSDTAVKTNLIYVTPPFPRISRMDNSCDGTRGDITFTQITRLATGWKWDFGDGSPSISLAVNQPTIKHTYGRSGKYLVTHTAINGACTATDTTSAYVLLKQNPKLSSVQSEICGSDGMNVQINNVDTNYKALDNSMFNNFYSNLKWQYGDGTDFIVPTNNSWATSYNTTLPDLTNGKQDVRAITSSSFFNCLDTTNYVNVKIKGPIAGFIAAPNNCYKSPIVFTDTSSGRNGVALKAWVLQYGDGSLQSFSGNANAQHLYALPGRYAVTLTITDSQGCKATAIDTAVNAKGAKADFDWTPQPVQPNSSAVFTNKSIEGGNVTTNYNWRFSNGNQVYNNQPYANDITRSYAAITTDTVRLIANANGGNCIDTSTKAVPIKNINLTFTYTTTYITPNSTCPPARVAFTATVKNIVSVKWLFGDGTNAVNNPASHQYDRAGTYRVALIGFGVNGSSDTVYQDVIVKGPVATIASDVQQGCSPVKVVLTATVKNATSFTWALGDGTLLQTNKTFIEHTYTTPNSYTPRLILKDTAGGGCEVLYELQAPILADTLKVNFASEPYISCEAAIFPFSITKTSIADTVFTNALKYQWNFGTGNPLDTAQIEAPSFRYISAGSFPVTLKASSVAGCSDSITTTVKVKPIVKPVITGPKDICEAIAIQYNATSALQGAIKWNWVFNNGNIDTLQTPSPQAFKPSASPNIIVLTTTIDGCSDTTVYAVMVHAKPNINVLPKTPTICEGSSMQLIANDGVTYKWAPSQNISDATIANPLVSPVTNTRYIVNVTNAFGCINNDTAFVTVVNKFKLNVATDTFVCVNSTVILRASGAGAGATYKWINNVAGLSNINISNPLAAPTASPALYTVTGTDANNCFTETATTNVTVQPLPTVNAGADQVVPVGTSVVVNTTASADVVKYNWTPSKYLDCSTCASPTATPREALTYKVTATTKYGCSTTDDVAITLICVGNTLAMPSGFTPNNDKLNDVFYPLGRGIKIVKHFAIYSRWGDVIFEKSNFNINDKTAGWDGRFKGYEQPSGAYVYFIDVECDTGEPFSRKGTVTLIR